MLSASLSDPISESNELANFPDENPNPVMRLSKQGRLLYANRASEPLLQSWNQRLGDSIKGEGKSMLIEAVKSGAQQQEDFYCGDKVFFGCYCPIAR